MSPIASEKTTRIGWRIYLIALWVLGGLAIATTLIAFLPLPGWWVRVFDFPRPQIAVVAGIVLLAHLARGARQRSVADWCLAAALLAVVVYQSARIIPYTPLVSTQAKRSDASRPDARVKLLVANVLMYNRESSRLAALIRQQQPDVVLLLEPDQRWVDELEPTMAGFSHRLLRPLSNTYGMAFYSKLRLVGPQLRYLVQEDIPSVRARLVLPSGAEIEFRGLHPRPPVPTEHDRSTERDAELLVVGREVRSSKLPVIVAGDLNDVAWSATTQRFQRVSRLLDPRIGRGLYATFKADNPLLRWPVDHVFFSKQLQLVEMERLPDFGSDHFAMVITLGFEPEKAASHAAPEPADEADLKETQHTIHKAKEEN